MPAVAPSPGWSSASSRTGLAPDANAADASDADAAATTTTTQLDWGAAAASGWEEPPPVPSPGGRSGRCKGLAGGLVKRLLARPNFA